MDAMEKQLTPGDKAVRAKGRFKLKELLREAQDVCRDYQHREYLGDLRAIIDSLNHDRVVEEPVAPPQDRAIVGGEET